MVWQTRFAQQPKRRVTPTLKPGGLTWRIEYASYPCQCKVGGSHGAPSLYFAPIPILGDPCVQFRDLPIESNNSVTREPCAQTTILQPQEIMTVLIEPMHKKGFQVDDIVETGCDMRLFEEVFGTVAMENDCECALIAPVIEKCRTYKW
eukprot:Gb_20966 [translate_table: standard]